METMTKEAIEQKRELLAALHRELKSGYGVTSIKREEQTWERIEALEAELGKAQALSNFRVKYVAPIEPKHSFEPTCVILADSTFGVVRVFDVPDPDESQRAVAEFACRAMNGFEGLVAALQQFISIYPENARRHPDVAIAIHDAEKVLAAVKGS